MNKDRAIIRWTQPEVDQLRKLYASGLTAAQSAREMGMEFERVRARLRWEFKSGQILANRKAWRASQQPAPNPGRTLYTPTKAGPKVTPEALTHRAQRYAAPHRGITGMFFGDPPVGFSALDQRA
jgi:hypothetical protein